MLGRCWEGDVHSCGLPKALFNARSADVKPYFQMFSNCKVGISQSQLSFRERLWEWGRPVAGTNYRISKVLSGICFSPFLVLNLFLGQINKFLDTRKFHFSVLLSSCYGLFWPGTRLVFIDLKGLTWWLIWFRVVMSRFMGEFKVYFFWPESICFIAMSFKKD